MSSIHSQLGSIRKRRGVGVTELARKVGVSRQTIHAIEAGSFVPNTEVALKLARELGVSVEELFALTPDAEGRPAAVQARVLSAGRVAEGMPARLCRLSDGWACVPASAVPVFLPDADGVISRCGQAGGSAEIFPLSGEEPAGRRIVVAGCDPAMSLLAGIVERTSGVGVIPAPASSQMALQWMVEGSVQIAGSHLEDAATGEFNLPFLRRNYPGEDFAVVTYARWEEGLAVPAGNPKRISTVEHLASARVRIINREKGSGSRGLLDRLLKEAGIESEAVAGYRDEVRGHLAAAYAVYTGTADCCVATRSAAQAYGLGFFALRSERYDFVLRRGSLELPAVQAVLDSLQRADLRRKLEMLAGYDTSRTGTVLA